MLRIPQKYEYILRVDGVRLEFLLVRDDANVSSFLSSVQRLTSSEQLGDYGYFIDSGMFCGQGNVFTDIKALTTKADFVPTQHSVSILSCPYYSQVIPAKFGWSLPNNCAFNSLLASLSVRLTNAYLVTRLVRLVPRGKSNRCLTVGTEDCSTMSLCTIVKPLVWFRDVDTGFLSMERLDVSKGTSVKYVNEGSKVVAKL